MDGPNTNWSVPAMLHGDRCGKDYPKIIDIGPCSLYILHGTFKSSVKATDWFLNKILKAMWKLFDDAPARWDTYTKICEVDEFRLMFWSYIVSNPLSLGSSFNIDTGKDTGIVRNRIVGVCSTTHLHLARRVVKIRHY